MADLPVRAAFAEDLHNLSLESIKGEPRASFLRVLSIGEQAVEILLMRITS